MSRALRGRPALLIDVAGAGLVVTGPGAAGVARDVGLYPSAEPGAWRVAPDRIDDLTFTVERYEGAIHFTNPAWESLFGPSEGMSS